MLGYKIASVTLKCYDENCIDISPLSFLLHLLLILPLFLLLLSLSYSSSSMTFLNIYWKLTANEQLFSLYSFNSANSYSSKCLSVLSNAYKWMKDKLYWIACLEAGYICWKNVLRDIKMFVLNLPDRIWNGSFKLFLKFFIKPNW